MLNVCYGHISVTRDSRRYDFAGNSRSVRMWWISTGAAKCIIELDGSQHGDRHAVSYDLQRTQWFEERGYRVLRIWNSDLLRDIDAVLEYVGREIRRSSTPPRFASQIDPPSRGG
jgi:Protein of unknown function (DUF559)